MLRRLLVLAVCGLAPIFSVQAETPSVLPLSAELHVGTAGTSAPRLIWIPTRWAPAVSQVRLMRRLVGTPQWQALDGMQEWRDREKLTLTHAMPADFARLRKVLLSDFTRAAMRGFASLDDLSKLPPGDYEYGLFARLGDADFLETPVATVIWKQPAPRIRDAGLKPLGVFRDANGVQVQMGVDARRMLSWAVGVRVIERRGGFVSPELYPLRIPATREGWTTICHRLQEPLPTELIFRVEDAFGDSVEQSIDIDPDAGLGKPVLDSKACMPVQPPLKGVYKMPRAKLSEDLELFVGENDDFTRVVWMPKKWPAGMEAVQIMRRWGTEPWTEVSGVKTPSEEFRNRLQAARTPQQFARLRQDLRSAWGTPLMGNLGVLDLYSNELPEGVVEYGAFPVISGTRAAAPAATVPWLVGTKTDADFGISDPRIVRDGKSMLAVFSVDATKLNEKAGNLKILQVSSDRDETLYADVMDGGGPRTWKHLCVPIVPGQTKAVKFNTQTLFGVRSTVIKRIDDAPSAASDPAALAQCFVPAPPTPPSRPPMAIQDVTSSPPMPAPPPPPRTTLSRARITHAVSPDAYYPSGSIRRGEEGEPVIRVCVGPSGKLLREPQITDSSGFPVLDSAAIQVAKAMRYAAAVENGTALPESCIMFKVKFHRLRQ